MQITKASMESLPNKDKCRCLFCDRPVTEKNAMLITHKGEKNKTLIACNVCCLLFMAKMQTLVNSNSINLPHLSDGIH